MEERIGKKTTLVTGGNFVPSERVFSNCGRLSVSYLSELLTPWKSIYLRGDIVESRDMLQSTGRKGEVFKSKVLVYCYDII